MRSPPAPCTRLTLPFPLQVETQLFDLFAAQGANDEQLDFMDGRLLYASGKRWCCNCSAACNPALKAEAWGGSTGGAVFNHAREVPGDAASVLLHLACETQSDCFMVVMLLYLTAMDLSPTGRGARSRHAELGCTISHYMQCEAGTNVSIQLYLYYVWPLSCCTPPRLSCPPPLTAKQGWATTELPPGGQAPPGASMEPLLDAILREVPPPGADVNAPFSMLVSMIER